MEKLIQKINKIPKSYFSLTDIQKISNLKEASLKVTMNRLLKRRELYRVMKGIYALNYSKIDWKQFAVELYNPSYVSFESALSYYNILSQKTFNVVLATIKRSKKIATKNNIIIYHHIKPSLFWGYKMEQDFLIAKPEKAFLDLAYLSLNGYAKFDIEDMNLNKLDKMIIRKYLKKFSNKKLDNLILKIKDF